MAEVPPYNPKDIEEKWQKHAKETGVYIAKDTGDKKVYVLDMFPYPSGAGLHVGHPKGYIATDVYARMKRMQGYNVLHPMGWDAFGLPAEQYAIQNKVHPSQAVRDNVKRFKEQLSLIGLDYDWSREINTTDPEYYRWTQWIFLQLYKKGLAYESHAPINWCPSCQTGLANEDLEDGKCERCGSAVEKKPMRQWVLKITEYADRMLEDLSLLPKWPEHIKEMQRHWIGKKEGVIVNHTVEGTDVVISTFSAYPAWLFADTYIVVAPEHPLVQKLITDQPEEKEVGVFIDTIKQQPLEERREVKEKLGMFTGRYAIDPLRKERFPIWIANFAVMDFGTGAIRCSAHDERDVEFAQKYSIPLRKVVGAHDDVFVDAHDNRGTLEDSGPFSGKKITAELINEMTAWIEKEGYGKRHTTYRLQDWVFSRQRYWGEPIPLIHCSVCGVVPVPENELPVRLPEVERYEPAGTGESPLATISEWVNTTCPTCGGSAIRETNTMPQWAGSCWYYLRYMDPKNETALIDKNKEKHWAPVDLYVGGAEHATRHLIYARFWHKFLYDIGVVSTLEPFTELHSVGLILAEDGRKMSKRFGNVINPDDVIKKWGADAFRLYEMFLGPFDSTTPWSDKGLVGTKRFLDKVWRFTHEVLEKNASQSDTSLSAVLTRATKKIGKDIEKFKFNTAVSTLMICLNELSAKTVSLRDIRTFLALLAPFAPHISEELWVKAGGEDSIHISSWPDTGDDITEDTNVLIAVQVNGKHRATIQVLRDTEQEAVEALSLEDPHVQKFVFGKEVRKIIFVKNRILNVVV